MVAGGATAIGGAVLLSLAVFGLEINIDWYRNCIEPFVGGVMPAFNVQSIDGFLARLETGPALLMEWTPLAASLWHKIVRSIVLVGDVHPRLRGHRPRGDRSAARRRGRSSATALEFSIVLVLAVVTSPVSWSHYYLLLLLPWALYLGGRLGLPDDAATRWLMAGGIAARVVAGHRAAARLRPDRRNCVADDRVGLDVRRAARCSQRWFAARCMPTNASAQSEATGGRAMSEAASPSSKTSPTGMPVVGLR